MTQLQQRQSANMHKRNGGGESSAPLNARWSVVRRAGARERSLCLCTTPHYGRATKGALGVRRLVDPPRGVQKKEGEGRRGGGEKGERGGEKERKGEGRGIFRLTDINMGCERKCERKHTGVCTSGTDPTSDRRQKAT
jgi:hypothetical protein